MKSNSFDHFAKIYDEFMGEKGDYTHQKTIDPALFKLVKTTKNKVIYDIGCGNGYISRKLAIKGAKEIWASDISPSLIKIAKKKSTHFDIKYFVSEATDFTAIPQNYFDLVIMNMAIHYVSDIDKLFSSIAKALKPKGRFVFTTDHPFHSLAYFDIEKINNIEEILKDAKNYTKESVKEFPNHWDKKTRLKIFRRPFSFYINILSKNALFVDGMIEPPTKRSGEYEKQIPFFSPIPFKFALSAKKVA